MGVSPKQTNPTVTKLVTPFIIENIYRHWLVSSLEITVQITSIPSSHHVAKLHTLLVW